MTVLDAETRLRDEGSAPLAGRPQTGARRVWRRIRRDPFALASAIVLTLIVGSAIAGPPLLERALGHSHDQLFPYAIDTQRKPVGPWTRVPDLQIASYNANGFRDADPPGAHTTLLPLGADGTLGRDELERLVIGARISLFVGICATLIAVFVGTLLGSAAAYFGGWTDRIVARLTELVMAFPLLLVVIVLGVTRLGTRFDAITLHGTLSRGTFTAIVLIGAFTWFYPARIVRAQILSLRQREFVEAATMTGASDWRILRSHLVPHLGGTLVAYGLIAVGTNILLEAGLTFFGVGIKTPDVSWGKMITDTWGGFNLSGLTVTYRPTERILWLTLLPSAAIFLTVLSLNLLGDAIRDALDPGGNR
jgi:ABC-type dipeptide/oligopeptide/nickel transport system permease subunit